MRDFRSRLTDTARSAAAGFGLIAVAGCSATGPETWSESFTVTGEAVPALAAFDSTVMAFMERHDITGGQLAVTRAGRVVMERGYTYRPRSDDITVEPTSLFRIASISKPITAVAILELVERGAFELGDPVVQHLPLEPPQGGSVDPRLADVTVRNLLEHLGGWDRDESFDPMFRDFEISQQLGRPLPIDQADIIRYMSGQPLDHDPGSTYAYSNYGYLLLGRLVEQASGDSYEDFVREQVLASVGATGARLGRSRTEHRLPGEVAYHAEGERSSVFALDQRVRAAYGDWNLENMDAHGGWLASAGDLARFAASFDVPEDHPVLEASSIERMFGLPENVAADAFEPGGAYYALGWAVRDYGEGERNTWHAGSLPGTHTLMVRRRDGIGWVVLFNRRGASFDEIDSLLHPAADRVRDWPTAAGEVTK